MLKKMVSIALCAIMCVTVAFAADVTDSIGKVKATVGPLTGSVTVKPYFSWIQAVSVANETVRSKSQVANLYSKATITDSKSGKLYKTADGTGHYTQDYRVVTPQFQAYWNQPAVTVNLTAYAKARYTNNCISQHSSLPLQATLGGEDYNGYRTYKQPVITEGTTFGIGKKAAMTSVIDNTFGYNLSDFNYVSYAELWTDEAIPEEHEWLQCILRDIFVEIEEGQFMPMGFLYKDDTAYTVVEQPDGTLSLTQYSLLPETNAVTAQGNESSSNIPEYQVVDTQAKRTDRALIDSMYQ